MKRVASLEIKVRRKHQPSAARIRVMHGLQGRVLFWVAGVAWVEIDREKARAALARNDAWVRARWQRWPQCKRDEWERQVARWQKILE